ncbi:hypothetical protein HPT25_26610 [Bacillus sp. BRMEA1]|uniref:hypothetical protein n=1 Tax=Neobacillus endophyticus TaxID=2738405 RepID=UPI0015646DD2|nr:hypothetical protein [Neobacillus endophyticus]NRD80904.1 hypothetical protein [Neobacillus endophyticus]
MKKIICIMLIISCVLVSPNIGTVFAASNDKSPTYEENLFEIGYQSVDEVLKAFEQHYKRKLRLPCRVPPVAFTHIFGRFSDLDGDLNDTFEVMFISDKSPENHYQVDVRPAKYRISINNKDAIKTYELKDGNKAIYMVTRVSNILIFEKDNWQYMLGINKRISDKVTPQTLVEIANSIDYAPNNKR